MEKSTESRSDRCSVLGAMVEARLSKITVDWSYTAMVIGDGWTRRRLKRKDVCCRGMSRRIWLELNVGGQKSFRAKEIEN
jgi:hypothetical protein